MPVVWTLSPHHMRLCSITRTMEPASVGIAKSNSPNTVPAPRAAQKPARKHSAPQPRRDDYPVSRPESLHTPGVQTAGVGSRDLDRGCEGFQDRRQSHRSSQSSEQCLGASWNSGQGHEGSRAPERSMGGGLSGRSTVGSGIQAGSWDPVTLRKDMGV
jgi:hypothetical protein